MLRFAIALAAYATRLILPIIIGATSVGAALLLGVFPIFDAASVPTSSCGRGWSCLATYPSPRAWQMPAAILIGVAGLAVAVLIALWNRRHPQPRPVPPVSSGWEAGPSKSMLRFRVALVAYSARQALPFVMTLVVVCGAFYLGAIPRNYGDYAAWQTPAAVLIGVVGLGLAFGIAVWNRWHPKPRPLPPLPAGWQ